MDTRAIFAIAVVISGVALDQASNWWERAFATYISSETSPDGCLRVDTYKAYRVLPSQFHRIPHPDPSVTNDLGSHWDAEVFDRAYEVSTGRLLGETIVFDPAVSFDFMYWGDPASIGRRTVVSAGFPLVDTPRCSDRVTLAKLEAYYEQKREAGRAEQEILRKEYASAGSRIDPNH